MGLYRRLARSKRGMGTIFGGLFFVILILMGFNLMLWVFIQQDSYNSVISQMNQVDQQAVSELIVPQQPGAQNFTGAFGICAGCTFNIAANNNGGSAVVITRIYITQCTGSTTCPGGTASNVCAGAGAPCIINPSGTTADPSCSVCWFTNGNFPAGATRQLIAVSGLNINDGGVYRINLATSRGRLFSFAYPWQAPPIVINQASIFTLNIGPIGIFFDFNSFNFTMTSQTQSHPAWVTPDKAITGQPGFILWIKVVNNSNFNVTINKQSGLLLTSYTGSNAGSTPLFIVDPRSQCPAPGGGCTTGILPYTTPIVLPAATAAGPSPPMILKFAATVQGGSTGVSISQDGTYLAFFGFFYTLNGNFQGETVPFVAVNVCGSYPTPC